jgi:hypothetical protein
VKTPRSPRGGTCNLAARAGRALSTACFVMGAWRRTHLWFLFVASAHCGPLSYAPSLMRHLASDEESTRHHQPVAARGSLPGQGWSYAIATALDAEAAKLFDQLFGASLASAAPASVLKADLCAPLAPGAPPLLLLAAGESPPSRRADSSADNLPPAAALAVADVWVAALSAAEHEEGTSSSGASDADVAASSAAARLDAVLERTSAAARALRAPAELEPSEAPAAPFHLLLVLADADDGGVTALKRRLDELRARDSALDHVAVSFAARPGADGSGASELLGRFARASRSDYLLHGARRVPASVGLRDATRLIGELLGVGGVTADRDAAAHCAPSSLLAMPDEWPALIGCEDARRRAHEAARKQADVLRKDVLESARNPLHDFAKRADRIGQQALRAYCGAAARWQSRSAYTLKRQALLRDTTARDVRLTRLQLAALREDAFASFQAELVLLMAAAGSYNRPAAKLRRKTAKAFEQASRAALPLSLVEGARHGPVLARRAEQTLRRRMLAEVEAHEAEAVDLPPREQDVAPAPWWKQIMVQVISTVFNLAQAYLLQYLPAKRKDLANERAMPRAPLF